MDEYTMVPCGTRDTPESVEQCKSLLVPVSVIKNILACITVCNSEGDLPDHNKQPIVPVVPNPYDPLPDNTWSLLYDYISADASPTTYYIEQDNCSRYLPHVLAAMISVAVYTL